MVWRSNRRERKLEIYYRDKGEHFLFFLKIELERRRKFQIFFHGNTDVKANYRAPTWFGLSTSGTSSWGSVFDISSTKDLLKFSLAVFFLFLFGLDFFSALPTCSLATSAVSSDWLLDNFGCTEAPNGIVNGEGWIPSCLLDNWSLGRIFFALLSQNSWIFGSWLCLRQGPSGFDWCPFLGVTLFFTGVELFLARFSSGDSSRHTTTSPFSARFLCNIPSIRISGSPFWKNKIRLLESTKCNSVSPQLPVL